MTDDKLRDAAENMLNARDWPAELLATVLCPGYSHTSRGVRSPDDVEAEKPCTRCRAWAKDIIHGFVRLRDELKRLDYSTTDTPPEPTEEMVKAGLNAEIEPGVKASADIGVGVMRIVVRAVLAAAPSINPAEKIEHILRRDFNRACDEFEILPEEYERGAFLDVLVRAALAAAHTQHKEG